VRLAYEKIAVMKKVAFLLILFGSGLAAFGISGFSGEITTNNTGRCLRYAGQARGFARLVYE
jgi:hypothetical protein